MRCATKRPCTVTQWKWRLFWFHLMAFSITSTWLCQAIVIGTTSRCVNCFRSKVLFIFIIRCSVRGTFEMWANGIFIARCLASQFSVMQQASNSIFFACRWIVIFTLNFGAGGGDSGIYCQPPMWQPMETPVPGVTMVSSHILHFRQLLSQRLSVWSQKKWTEDKAQTNDVRYHWELWLCEAKYCWTYIFEQRWWWWWWWWVVEMRKKKPFMMMLWTELNSRSHPLEVHFTEAYTRFRLLLLLLLSAWELAIHIPADYRPFRSVLAFEFQEFTRQWSMHTELSMHWTFIAHQQQQQQFIITSHSFWALAINI